MGVGLQPAHEDAGRRERQVPEAKTASQALELTRSAAAPVTGPHGGSTSSWPPASATDTQGGELSAEDGEGSGELVYGGQRGFSLAPGSTLGRYQVLARLGAGAMGIVVSAWDPELERRVAIKVLRGGGGDALLREARALASVHHQNVLTVFDVGTVRVDGSERIFVAMEYVPGGSLRDWNASRTPKVAELIALLIASAHGLAAVHAAGLVHRDFKPDNVMVSQQGQALVADFGLARRTTPDADLDPSASALALPNHSTFAGTPAYMAPEQFLGRGADARSDQFAFAVSAWELLFGERPFAGRSISELSVAVTEGIVRTPPTSHRVPHNVVAALRRALTVDSDKRFSSMEALIEAMTSRRSRGAWLMGGAVALAALVSAFVWSTSDPCAGSRAAVDRLMGSEAAAEIEAHVLPWAWTRLQQRADRLGDALGASCHDEVERTVPPALQELGARCLRRRVKELELVVAGFDATTSETFGEGLDRLSSVDACEDLDLLARPTAVPEDPKLRAEVDALELDLARVATLDALARHEESLTLARELEPAARALDFAPATAEVLYWIGSNLEREGKIEAATVAIQEAIQLAARGRHDELEAKAWIVLIFAVGYTGGRPAEALAWLPAAEAAVARHGSLAQYEARLHQGVAPLEFALGRNTEAEQRLERALSLWEASVGTDHPWTANAAIDLAIVKLRSRDLDRALELSQNARRALDAAYGETHRASVNAALCERSALLELGRTSESDELLAKLVVIVSEQEHALRPDVLTEAGHRARAQGDPSAARGFFERALAALEANGTASLPLGDAVRQALARLDEKTP